MQFAFHSPFLFSSSITNGDLRYCFIINSRQASGPKDWQFIAPVREGGVPHGLNCPRAGRAGTNRGTPSALRKQTIASTAPSRTELVTAGPSDLRVRREPVPTLPPVSLLFVPLLSSSLTTNGAVAPSDNIAQAHVWGAELWGVAPLEFRSHLGTAGCYKYFATTWLGQAPAQEFEPTSGKQRRRLRAVCRTTRLEPAGRDIHLIFQRLRETRSIVRATRTLAGTTRTLAGTRRTVVGTRRTIAGTRRTVAGKGRTVAGTGRTVAGTRRTLTEMRRTVAPTMSTLAGTRRSSRRRCGLRRGRGGQFRNDG
jgi:hypothetical protein